MLDLIVSVFWFLLPAGIANMGPVLFKWLPILKTPVDFNKKFRKKPVFGKNKTWRGLVCGVLVAIIVVYLQKLLYPFMQNYSLVDYSATSVFLLGFLLGFGALLGDLVESFAKRQRNTAPGKSLPPWDQLDWIIGALVLGSLLVPLSVSEIAIALVLFGLLHPLMNILGYALRIKKNKF
ncbi:CDP-archaeol synthase [Candidatus Woesearchaeota archaeon]|nr:CDP-archaeol synthase [Candidatus Woesearchaeota archaeon]MBW3006425.1 CDP-archaeol synthase [Candidatus Woesearchaeota archaeon]